MGASVLIRLGQSDFCRAVLGKLHKSAVGLSDYWRMPMTDVSANVLREFPSKEAWISEVICSNHRFLCSRIDVVLGELRAGRVIIVIDLMTLIQPDHP